MNSVKVVITDVMDFEGIMPTIAQEKTTVDLRDFLTEELQATCAKQRTWSATTLENAKSQECAVIRSFIDFLLQKYSHRLTPQQQNALKRIVDFRTLFQSVSALELKNSLCEIRAELVDIVKTQFNLRMLEKLDEALQKLNSGVLTYLARVVAIQHQFERCLVEMNQSVSTKEQTITYCVKVLERLTEPKTAILMLSSLKQAKNVGIAVNSIAQCFLKLGRLKEAYELINNSGYEITDLELYRINVEASINLGIEKIVQESQDCFRIKKHILQSLINFYSFEAADFTLREFRELMSIIHRLTQCEDKKDAYDHLFSAVTKPNRLPHMVDAADEIIKRQDDIARKELLTHNLISLLTQDEMIRKPGMAEKAMAYMAHESWYWGKDYCLNQVLNYAIEVKDRHLGYLAISFFHPVGLEAFAETIERFNEFKKGKR